MNRRKFVQSLSLGVIGVIGVIGAIAGLKENPSNSISNLKEKEDMEWNHEKMRTIEIMRGFGYSEQYISEWFRPINA